MKIILLKKTCKYHITELIFPLGFCQGNQGDANFLVGLQKTSSLWLSIQHQTYLIKMHFLYYCFTETHLSQILNFVLLQYTLNSSLKGPDTTDNWVCDFDVELYKSLFHSVFSSSAPDFWLWQANCSLSWTDFPTTRAAKQTLHTP